MTKVKLTINNNGSLKIEGEVEIVDTNGKPYGLGGRDVISLCRCGQSKNKGNVIDNGREKYLK